MKERVIVAVVDDDESVRECLPDLLGELGHDAVAFSSGEDYLASGLMTSVSCMLLDLAMHGMSGTELYAELVRRKLRPPVIFITARRDRSTRAQLCALGAVDCLIKPFTEPCLIEALNLALGSKARR